jgi:hypothetical protein
LQHWFRRFIFFFFDLTNLKEIAIKAEVFGTKLSKHKELKETQSIFPGLLKTP